MENGSSVWLDELQNDTEVSVALSPEELLALLRQIKIKDLYGEHFQAIFVATLAVGVLGCLTNALNVTVLSRTSLANPMNLFLLVLAASDLVEITTQLTHALHYFAGFRMYPHFDWVLFYTLNTFLETAFVFVGNWLVAVIGIWRLMFLAWPLRSRTLCSRFRAKLTIVLVFVFSCLLSSLVFAQLTYTRAEYMGLQLYDLSFREFVYAQDSLFLKVQWGVQLLKGLLPMLIMVGATAAIVAILFWRRKQRRLVLNVETSAAVNHRITVMLLVLLVLYWLNNLPDAFMFLIQLVSDGERKLARRYREATDIIRIFSLTNLSASFFVYYALGEDFRTKFHKIFCGGRLSRRTPESKSVEGLSQTSTLRSGGSQVQTQAL